MIYEKHTPQVTVPSVTCRVIVEALLCAWCLAEQGIAAGEGSHGICESHRQVMMAQYWRLKAAKRGTHQ